MFLHVSYSLYYLLKLLEGTLPQSFIEYHAASAVASLVYGMLPKCCIIEYGPFASFPSP